MALSIVALVAAYNEEDIIASVVKALIDDGIQVYFIDHRSTDGTKVAVERYRGRGVLGIETFPREAPPDDTHRFTWEAILRRKEVLAGEIDADWFIHHDADEFRESPWPNETLSAGIARVDAAGYNAIDFEVLNFCPTADDSKKGDVRDRLLFYEPGARWDRKQIKCWKKGGHQVVLAASGGHSAEFAGRRVCPVRFLLRHYPIRSQAHGERKVFQERRARFDPDERARGWHVQYDAFEEGTSFLKPAASLIRYDPDAVRFGLMQRHRGVERLERALGANQDVADRLTNQLVELRRHLAVQDAELSKARGDLEVLNRDLAERAQHLRAQDAELEQLRAEREVLERALGELRAHLRSQDAELDRLRTERATALDALAELRSERDGLSVERDTLTASLEIAYRQAESQSATIARLRPERDRLRHDIEALRAHLLSQDVLADQVRRELARTRSDLARARDDAESKGTTIEYILASRSWRLTSPLRALDRFARGRAAESTGRGLALANFPARRGLRLWSDVAGFWGDGWAGPDLRFRIRADRRLKGLRVAGRVPDGLVDGQELRWSTGGREWAHRASPGPFEWLIELPLEAGAVIDVSVVAARVWRPAAAGSSSDERELAWNVVAVEGKR